jgi:hypothetical protein
MMERPADNEIIQEAAEAVTKGLPCAYLVKPLLEVAKNQKSEIDILIRKKETLRDEIARQRAVIDRQVETIQAGYKLSIKQQAEIERMLKEIERKKFKVWILEEELEKAEALNDALCNDVDIKLNHIYALGEKLSKAKSEAYREFAERLKAQDGYDNHIFDDCASLLIPEEYRKGRDEKIKEVWGTIDNLVKELTESDE